jgi:hypothetical protein
VGWNIFVLNGPRLAKPDGITMYPIERLGNQLFIYAAGLAQARRLGAPFYVNLGFYRHARPRRSYAYSYDLGCFANGADVPKEDAYHRPVFLGLPALRAATMWHTRVMPRLPKVAPPVFMEHSFRYDERIERVEPGTTLLGHFQSWRYFGNIADELRRRMLSLTKPSEWYLDMAERVGPGRGSIVLHVRRGDYVLPEQQKLQGLSTRRYYVRALSALRRMGYDGEVFMASDSLDAAQAELAGEGTFIPLDPPAGTDAFELVVLMSRADAIVAANSSFSWWSGFIGERPGHVVIAPRPWFTHSRFDTQDLLPRDWFTLDRN